MAKQTFSELVREAARVERELQKYNSPKSSRLTAKAFVREAMRVAAVTDKQLNELQAWLNTDNTPACLTFLFRAEKFTVDTSAGVCSRPPKNAQRLSFLGRDSAIAELSGSPFTIMALFALAARNAAAKHPDAFGDVTDPDTFDKERATLEAKRDELRKQLATAYTAADLLFTPVGDAGLCKATFAITAGMVSAFPTETAAERLINWGVKTNYAK